MSEPERRDPRTWLPPPRPRTPSAREDFEREMEYRRGLDRYFHEHPEELNDD